MQQQSSRRLNQLVGGKDTICRKHNQNREPKCNFTITTLSRSTKAVNDTKKFTIPRNSVFIAVNDCWATQDTDTPQKSALAGFGGKTAGSLGSSSTAAADSCGSVEDKRRHRQPVLKAESLPQYCDKSDSIERKTAQRRSSNESAAAISSSGAGGGICYATFSKGMYKPQHIYENDCIMQRTTTAVGQAAAGVLPARSYSSTAANSCTPNYSQQSSELIDDNASMETASTAANPHPLYAVVNKNNKSKNKQSADLMNGPAVTSSAGFLLNNNNNATNNGNNNIKTKTSSQPCNAPTSLTCSSDSNHSDIMGNMLPTEAAIVEGSGGDHHQQQHHYFQQGLMANKTPPANQLFDPMITTTSITADMKSDSNAEHSIYAKVWKGPRKTSESKMYEKCLCLR